MQPVSTTAVEDRVAVAVLPAPQTSPVAVKNAEVSVLVGETSSVVPSQTCRPPVDVTDVGATASAGTAARAVTISASTAMMPIFLIKVFLLYLVGLYRSLRRGLYLPHRLRAVECLFAGAERCCEALSLANTSVRPFPCEFSSTNPVASLPLNEA